MIVGMRKIICPWCGLQWDTQMDAIRCANVCEQLFIADRIDSGIAFPGDTNVHRDSVDS